MSSQAPPDNVNLVAAAHTPIEVEITLAEDLCATLNAQDQGLRCSRGAERMLWTCLSYILTSRYQKEAKEAFWGNKSAEELATEARRATMPPNTVFKLNIKGERREIRIIARSTNYQITMSLDEACALLNNLHKETREHSEHYRSYYMRLYDVVCSGSRAREEWWTSISTADPAEQAKKLEGPPKATYELNLSDTI